jgi:hypothetical protein
MAATGRFALFFAASATLLAAAILVGAATEHPARPARPSARRVALQPPPARIGPPGPELVRSARRFLGAFTRYEVGDRAPSVTAALRATATRSFARVLLRQPAGPSAGSPAAARLGSVSVAVVSADPPIASVGAVAERAAGPEQLAFLFVRRDGVWLASAPGE